MALKRVPMATFLMEKGHLTKEQHEEALKVQGQTDNTDLGRILIDLGHVGEREVLEAESGLQPRIFSGIPALSCYGAS